jgi:hypothetical protein
MKPVMLNGVKVLATPVLYITTEGVIKFPVQPQLLASSIDKLVNGFWRRGRKGGEIEEKVAIRAKTCGDPR